MKKIELHELNSRNFNEKVQNAVVLKLRTIFDLEGTDLAHINDAIWDSKLRILCDNDLTVIRFSQRSFQRFNELLMAYKTY